MCRCGQWAVGLTERTGCIKTLNSRQHVNRLYWEEELSTAECGKRLGISGSYVSALMRAWGIPARKYGDWIAKSAKWNLLDADVIVRLYVEELLSAQEIALKYNVSRPIIAKVLDASGRTTPDEI